MYRFPRSFVVLAALAVLTFLPPAGQSDAQTRVSLASGWERLPGLTPTDCREPWNQIYTDGSGLVAFDACTPSIWTSPDGHTWKRIALPPLQLDNVLSWRLFVSGQTFILTGNAVTYQPAGPPSARLWVSSDAGATWRSSTTPITISSVVAGRTGLLAIADGPATAGGGLWTSSDGLTWQPAPGATDVFKNAWLSALVHWDGGWIVGGQSMGAGSSPPEESLWASTDGHSWSRVSLGTVAPGSQVWALVASGSHVLAGTNGPDGTSILVSQDAAHWQRAKSVPPGILPYGNSNLVGWQDGFVAFLDEAGETAVWTSPDGSLWTRVGGNDLFRGTAQISGAVSFRSGLVATGSFAPPPPLACLMNTGADQNDVRAFQPALFLWITGSGSSPAPTDRADPETSKLLLSDIGTHLAPNDAYDYRSMYVNFCWETRLLGRHTAYRLTFPSNPGSSYLPPNLQGQELTIVAQDAAHAQRAFKKARVWMFLGTKTKTLPGSPRLGDETQEYSFHLPTDILPPGVPYRGFAVLWRRGAVIGEIYTTDLGLAASLARKQYARMESGPSTTGKLEGQNR